MKDRRGPAFPVPTDESAAIVFTRPYSVPAGLPAVQAARGAAGGLPSGARRDHDVLDSLPQRVRTRHGLRSRHSTDCRTHPPAPVSLRDHRCGADAVVLLDRRRGAEHVRAHGRCRHRRRQRHQRRRSRRRNRDGARLRHAVRHLRLASGVQSSTATRRAIRRPAAVPTAACSKRSLVGSSFFRCERSRTHRGVVPAVIVVKIPNIVPALSADETRTLLECVQSGWISTAGPMVAASKPPSRTCTEPRTPWRR